MSKTSTKRVFVLPSLEENEKIVATAKADPLATPLTSKQFKEMVPLTTVRGRPRSENKKQLVSIRYSPEVIAYFRNTGEGWQARMDGVLREYIAQQSNKIVGD